MLYFASARTAIDKSRESITLPADFRLADLPGHILGMYENLAELKTVFDKSAWSVNEEIVYDLEGTKLQQNDVVAVIPPVSGG